MGPCSNNTTADEPLWPAFAEMLGDAVLLVDKAGTVRQANRAAARLIGVDVARLCSRPLTAFLDPRDADGTATVADALGRGSEAALEATVLAPDTKRVRVDMQVRPVTASVRWVVMRPVEVGDSAVRDAHLLHLASHDALTGLLNRRCLVDVLGREFIRARRYGSDLSVIMLDLDFFKSVNDTHGHLYGDQVLKKTAEIISTCLRESDVAARYGGEEFCVVLPDTDISGATTLAERIRRTIEEHPYECDGRRTRVTASLGVAWFDALAGNVRDLVDRADRALYEAKSRGRNTVYAWQSGGRGASVLLLAESTVTHDVNTSLADICGAQRRSALVALADLAARMEHREGHRGSHAQEVAELAVTIAARMGLSDHEIEDIRGAALVHDIGKTALPDRLLHQRGPLEPGQWRMVRQHAMLGEQILRRVKNLDREALLVRLHNEWFDGTDSPQPLRRDALPLGARIIGVAEAFRAMLSDRPYRRRLALAQAVEQLQAAADQRFDPELVSLVIHLVGQHHVATGASARLKLFAPAVRSA